MKVETIVHPSMNSQIYTRITKLRWCEWIKVNETDLPGSQLPDIIHIFSWDQNKNTILLEVSVFLK